MSELKSVGDTPIFIVTTGFKIVETTLRQAYMRPLPPAVENTHDYDDAMLETVMDYLEDIGTMAYTEYEVAKKDRKELIEENAVIVIDPQALTLEIKDLATYHREHAKRVSLPIGIEYKYIWDREAETLIKFCDDGRRYVFAEDVEEDEALERLVELAMIDSETPTYGFRSFKRAIDFIDTLRMQAEIDGRAGDALKLEAMKKDLLLWQKQDLKVAPGPH